MGNLQDKPQESTADANSATDLAALGSNTTKQSCFASALYRIAGVHTQFAVLRTFVGSSLTRLADLEQRLTYMRGRTTAVVCVQTTIVNLVRQLCEFERQLVALESAPSKLTTELIAHYSREPTSPAYEHQLAQLTTLKDHFESQVGNLEDTLAKLMAQ